jgi:hypothetical protein
MKEGGTEEGIQFQGTTHPWVDRMHEDPCEITILSSV